MPPPKPQERGQAHRGFAPERRWVSHYDVEQATLVGTCNGSFFVSTWLGYGTQLFGQTLV